MNTCALCSGAIAATKNRSWRCNAYVQMTVNTKFNFIFHKIVYAAIHRVHSMSPTSNSSSIPATNSNRKKKLCSMSMSHLRMHMHTMMLILRSEPNESASNFIWFGFSYIRCTIKTAKKNIDNVSKAMGTGSIFVFGKFVRCFDIEQNKKYGQHHPRASRDVEARKRQQKQKGNRQM